jgi:aldehyde:ferredoxin oxidoreductase
MMNYTKPNLMNGYANQILTINLDNPEISTPELNPLVRDYFIGGRGMGLYLLHQKISSRTSPYASENPLIICPGPLGGIPQFPGAGKCMALSLSPLTGIPGVSNFGGHFGAYLKYSGFDALEITGKAKQDSMIVIDSFRREIFIMEAPARDYVFDLEKEIAAIFTSKGYEKKNITFLTTGIGAARTTYGCINSHYYDPTKSMNGTNGDGVKGFFRTKQAGRTGIGSVMIDKKIRAIVIISEFPKGDNPYGAADWNKVKQSGAKLARVVKEVDPVSLKMYLKGSAGLITFMNKNDYQSLPVKNFQAGSDPRAGQICGNHYAEHLFDHRGMDGCFPGCNLRCTKGGCVVLKTGRDKGIHVWVDGPEYETAAGFGSNLGMWNPEFIMEANWHCDNYGIDTITTAVIMAFLMECQQRGYLTPEDMGGLDLTWGNEQAALEFIHRIVRQETEFAVEAGKGMLNLVEWISDRYTTRTGLENPRKEIMRFAMQTKGLPFSLYRTHRSLSMQGSYAAASDIGAHHAAAWLIKLDLLGAFPTFQDKARALISYPRVRLGNDNLGLCKLPWVDVFNPDSEKMADTDKYINPASQEIYADFYNGMLGTNMTWQEIFEQTDRDINLQRVMNALIYKKTTEDHDRIPDRAIGPIDDDLYSAEQAYNDQELCGILQKSLSEVQMMKTGEKRKLLMEHRKMQLDQLIQTYYQERGWSNSGIPRPDTLKKLGLWPYLNDEARQGILEMAV